MLAVLVGQASAENVLSGTTPGSVRVFSEPKFSERGVEWNLQGVYGYFVSTTVIPTLHIINQAINGSGAIVALAITCWVVKTLFRLIKTEYIKTIIADFPEEITTTKTTPAADHLFQVRDEEEERRSIVVRASSRPPFVLPPHV